jgi:hypothetical protein
MQSLCTQGSVSHESMPLIGFDASPVPTNVASNDGRLNFAAKTCVASSGYRGKLCSRETERARARTGGVGGGPGSLLSIYLCSVVAADLPQAN